MLEEDIDDTPEKHHKPSSGGERLRNNTQLLVEATGFKVLMLIVTGISVLGLMLYWRNVPHGVEVAPILLHLPQGCA